MLIPSKLSYLNSTALQRGNSSRPKNLVARLWHYYHYRSAVLLHWVGHLVILVSSAFPGEEAFLAHVEVEAFQAAVSERRGCHKLCLLNSAYSLPKSLDRVLLTNIAFCLMLCGLRGSESTTGFHQQKHFLRHQRVLQFRIIIPVEDWHPNHTLRLLLHPTQEMESLKKDLLEFSQEHKTGI